MWQWPFRGNPRFCWVRSGWDQGVLVEEASDASSMRLALLQARRQVKKRTDLRRDVRKTNETIDHRVDNLIRTALLPTWPTPLLITQAVVDRLVRVTFLAT